MAGDDKGTGLSGTGIALVVVGVLVVLFFLSSLVHLVVGLLWTVAELALVVLVVVLLVRFFFGRSRSD